MLKNMLQNVYEMCTTRKVVLQNFKYLGKLETIGVTFSDSHGKKLEHGEKEYVRFYLTNGLISKHVRLQCGLN